MYRDSSLLPAPVSSSRARPSQSICRKWYQLTGLQRCTLLLVLLAVSTLVLLYPARSHPISEEEEWAALERERAEYDVRRERLRGRAQHVPQRMPHADLIVDGLDRGDNGLPHHPPARHDREAEDREEEAEEKLRLLREDEKLRLLRQELREEQQELEDERRAQAELARNGGRPNNNNNDANNHINDANNDKDLHQGQVDEKMKLKEKQALERLQNEALAKLLELQRLQKQNHPDKGIVAAAEQTANGQFGSFRNAVESKDYGPKNSRQEAVVAMFRHAWKGYKDHAWGHDELLPVSRGHSEWFRLALTMVDALDTMYFMGLTAEFAEAREYIAHSLNLDQDVDVNLFECTIRVLGGLLSVFHLSHDRMFLDKANNLGERLAYAFNSGSKVPFSDVNLKTHRAHKPDWGSDSTTSEVSTIQLEFKDLSHLTGIKSYHDRVTEVMQHLKDLPKEDGLVPIFINANSGRFTGNTITLGARGDSYYEYLLKQWLQTGKTENMYKEMYLEAVSGIMRRLVKVSKPHGLTFIQELLGGAESPKMDHLVCFLPGTLALGAANGLDPSHLELAKKLMETCYQMYAVTATKLAPEIVYFQMGEGPDDILIHEADAHNLLRPETVESLFYLYRITKDKKYQEWGWEIFQAFERHCKVSTGGYSSLHSVKENPPRFRDKMESFFLGETIKYMFLLFGENDRILPLDKYVINTEAHPLPIFDPNDKPDL
eukprot:m.120304 g.120304  ORF g.120304 m.120304 type:complete len:718 (-) comp16175_c0_seq1:727-2880(-)